MASGKFAKAAEDAKRYVDGHDLERVITQMVNWVILERPAEPEAYMVRWLMDRCNEDQLKEVVSDNWGLRVERDLPPRPKPKESRSREAYEKYKNIAEGKGEDLLAALGLEDEAKAQAAEEASPDDPAGDAASAAAAATPKSAVGGSKAPSKAPSAVGGSKAPSVMGSKEPPEMVATPKAE